MIFEIHQIQSCRRAVNGIGGKWIVAGKEGLLAEAEEPVFNDGRRVIIRDKDNEVQMILKNSNVTLSKRLTNSELVTWELFEDGLYIGATCTKGVKVKGFFQSYIYDSFQYNGKIYDCYEVGFGSKGIYVCIYRNGELVAVIDRRLKVVNYLENYTCYLLYEEDYPAVIAYTIQYCISKCYIDFDDPQHCTEHLRLDTVQKEVLAKYDKTFIDKIKEKENKK